MKSRINRPMCHINLDLQQKSLETCSTEQTAD